MSREKVYNDPLALFGSPDVVIKKSPAAAVVIKQTTSAAVAPSSSSSLTGTEKGLFGDSDTGLFGEKPKPTKVVTSGMFADESEQPASIEVAQAAPSPFAEPSIFREVDTSKFLNKAKPKTKAVANAADMKPTKPIEEVAPVFEAQNTSGRGLGKS